jgi:hypothetical protein
MNAIKNILVRGVTAIAAVAFVLTGPATQPAGAQQQPTAGPQITGVPGSPSVTISPTADGVPSAEEKPDCVKGVVHASGPCGFHRCSLVVKTTKGN